MIDRNTLSQRLSQGVVTIIFEKINGQERIIYATLSEHHMPANSFAVIKNQEESSTVVTVWDTEFNGWRSFHFDSIVSVN